ncbi:hypothetical protein J5N97_013360 [Dioscorea zingiberensis]|uniref:cytokinin riboside 5'-monophosphate phosphoribohydrolase n=1 Tax=Dioscorea zingiberensis TaxID=325984 RepID=A0A9D5CQE6_9LILI|nr:hypothetical protein J5N97_013360 [Dioscorea zingiberensis]
MDKEKGEEKIRSSKFSRICVFCGSSSGRKASYQDAAVELGKELVGLLNVDGYYGSLLSFIDMAVDEGFISVAARHIILSAPSPKELLIKLEEYVPVHASNLIWEVEPIIDYAPSMYDISLSM